MKLQSLHDLFIEELQDLYSAENQILEALPELAENATSPELKRAFQQHLDQTRVHVQRLDQIFNQLGDDVDRNDKTCKGMKGIIKESEDLLDDLEEPEVADAGMIAGAQRVEHYEIAGYGTVRTYAQLLGRNEWVRLLEQTLNEEKQTDQLLTQLAGRINLEAKAA
ncbi:MAG TPA: ferritin-like domain-containing protein [Terriglobales bacterium]|jgi:ferritin-like metal-binding protein YciE|nr:ferritin-like domain-containing protein [Terriglobales bacterium]